MDGSTGKVLSGAPMVSDRSSLASAMWFSSPVIALRTSVGDGFDEVLFLRDHVPVPQDVLNHFLRHA